MHPTDTYDRFATTFNYPIDRDEIIEAAGTTVIDAPTGTSETIAEILGRTETETFLTPRDLHETILSNLGEQYIGRKFYDDRGTNVNPYVADTI